MMISFVLPKEAASTVLLISAVSADGVKTDYNEKSVHSGNYHTFEAGGQAPWKVTVSGWYPTNEITVNSNDGLISIYNDVASVCYRD